MAKGQSELPIKKPKLNVLADELLEIRSNIDRLKNDAANKEQELILEMRRVKKSSFRSGGKRFEVSFRVTKEKIKITADTSKDDKPEA